jgi:hypothetical protein
MPAALESRKAVEFYVVQLSQMPDGSFYVSMVAIMVDEDEPQLLDQQLLSQRVGGIDEATTLIREAVIGAER